MTTLLLVLGLLATVMVAAAVVSNPKGPAVMRAFLDARARRNFAVFCSLVGRDERTGAPLILGRSQLRMIAHWLVNRWSILLGHPESGKTSILILLVVWKLALDPSTRIVIVMATAGQAEKFLRAVATYIETNTDLHRIFPRLKPGAIRRADAYSVADAPVTMKDPNISTASPGSGSGALLGTRTDFLIFDDLVSRETSRSPQQREELHRWVTSTLLSRLAPNAQILACGTVWHPSDELHQLEKLRGFVTLRLPVLDPETNEPTWPERWPPDRIAERKEQLGSREFTRAFLCVAVDDASSVFRLEDVQAALDRGRDLPTYLYSGPTETGRCYLGADPAFTTTATADLSALAVFVVRPDGTRELLHVSSGRWSFDVLVQRIVETAGRYRASIAVETNGGGQYVHDEVKKHARGRILGLHTNAANKAVRIDRLNAELEARKWTFPARAGVADPEVKALANEILSFTNDEHLGDRLSALLLALDACREHENRPQVQVGRLVREPGGGLRIRL